MAETPRIGSTTSGSTREGALAVLIDGCRRYLIPGFAPK
jgi:hypothetical protein